ncbi:glycerophosphodiester phosphodiesterase family protein [Saccharopolyspora terrae]|uniref:Glycerophosphodiester phosphodiesterase family protein n=1 Tax=Saccharopolyspora terrae TaxID=2530384 RepID=A0A4R4VXY1_9PSEU|nr:glycerophosphodiester phosphodiesterase family protein [Saccharopolyspora terrae]
MGALSVDTTSARRRAAAGAAALGILATGLAVTPSVSANQTAPLERIHRDLLDHSDRAPLLAAAHRGAWRDHPENSLAAIDEAVRDGAEIVEIDVRKTADGHLVLMHDETVDRTTNGTGEVSDLTLAQIKQLRLKEHLGGEQAALTAHSVPTLDEAMLAVKGRAMVNLDKGWGIREDMYRVAAGDRHGRSRPVQGQPDRAGGRRLHGPGSRDPLHAHHQGRERRRGRDFPRTPAGGLRGRVRPAHRPAGAAGAAGSDPAGQPRVDQHDVAGPRRHLHRRGVPSRPGARLAGRRRGARRVDDPDRRDRGPAPLAQRRRHEPLGGPARRPHRARPGRGPRARR